MGCLTYLKWHSNVSSSFFLFCSYLLTSTCYSTYSTALMFRFFNIEISFYWQILGKIDTLRKKLVSVGKEHASLCAKVVW